jgi:hypothetical protein
MLLEGVPHFEACQCIGVDTKRSYSTGQSASRIFTFVACIPNHPNLFKGRDFMGAFGSLVLASKTTGANPFEKDNRRPRKPYMTDQRQRDNVIKQEFEIGKVRG